MKKSHHHHKHLKHKAIKEANAIQDSGSLPNEMIENKNFKKQFEAKESSLPHKQSKQAKHVSKRTSPQEIKEDVMEPDYVHCENEKWIHALQSQTQENTFRLNKKLSKHKKS